MAAARKLHLLLRSRDLRPALAYLATLPLPLTLLPNHALNALLRALAAAGRVRAATDRVRRIPTPTPLSLRSTHPRPNPERPHPAAQNAAATAALSHLLLLHHDEPSATGLPLLSSSSLLQRIPSAPPVPRRGGYWSPTGEGTYLYSEPSDGEDDLTEVAARPAIQWREGAGRGRE